MDLQAPATALAAMVRDGRISAEDLVAQAVERIDQTRDLNIFISTNPRAVEQAREVDRRIKSGRVAGRLAGVPVSIKDNICTRDHRTTCGSRMLEGYTPPYDATVVRRLLGEGAIIVGKTNMDEFAMGLTTEFSAFGPTRNPHNPQFVPGGSSGGSAASVATGASAVSLGSDTGGSVRNPASFCGVVGFKPTYGLVSRYGLISYANSIEQVGPLGRTIGDVALTLEVISGPDERDGTTVRSALREPDADGGGLERRKVGVVREMAPDGMDGGIRRALDGAVSRLESRGAACEEVSLGMVDYSVAAYYTITSTEAGSNLARYDNIRYGYDLPHEGYEFHRYIAASRGRFGPEVKRRIITGGFVPSAGYSGRYFLKALKVKSRLTREMDELLGRYDYLVSPTVPSPPFRLGEKIDDPVSLFLMDINTVTANLTGKPAVSVPFGESGGMPVGIQMMADSMNDARLLQAARALEGDRGR